MTPAEVSVRHGTTATNSELDERLHKSWQPVVEAEILFRDGKTNTFAGARVCELMLGVLAGVLDVASVEYL